MRREDISCHTRSGWVARFKAFVGTPHGGHGGHGNQGPTKTNVREQMIRDEVAALENDKARVGPYISGH